MMDFSICFFTHLLCVSSFLVNLGINKAIMGIFVMADCTAPWSCSDTNREKNKFSTFLNNEGNLALVEGRKEARKKLHGIESFGLINFGYQSIPSMKQISCMLVNEKLA